MAESKKRIAKTPIARLRKAETVREKASKTDVAPVHKTRLKKAGSNATRPAKALSKLLMREYYLPLPDNKVGRVLNKRRSIVPGYFKNSWNELRQVIWPGRRETIKLTSAVFIFAIVFGLLIALVDYLLDIIFKKAIL